MSIWRTRRDGVIRKCYHPVLAVTKEEEAVLKVAAKRRGLAAGAEGIRAMLEDHLEAFLRDVLTEGGILEEAERERGENKMTRVDTQQEGPANDLVLAINHYVSTSDHIGEGIAMEDHKTHELLFMIAHDPRNPTDLSDYNRLRDRIAEIQAGGQVSPRWEPMGQQGRFAQTILRVAPDQIRPLARELVRDGGKGGFGSPKAMIDAHMPEVRGKIMSMEGA